jgi:DNA-binding CsgD family transcriptional regulator
MRLRGITTDALSPCQALLVLIDLEQRSRISDTLLRACFKLTAAEAKLAVRIASGTDLDAASEKLRITRATARAQLRSIFAKTGVHRQSELVVLLSKLVGALPSETGRPF